ncbi:uncharacterized protein LOC115771887 [Drosophila novamexicana]|uniref:uncharacterized protein LOC115771887 n=1 Tax=Drosophila novamexicana TaxID=47314 RepID=UPI0011E5B130|nr:uncharacterized protein LOC115771887 [Drosophila novamexicana]
MAEATSADSFKMDEIVFAQKYGYIPWPAKLIDKSNSRNGMVQFVLTNDRHLIPYGKIWIYNEQSKRQFVTRQTTDYEDFRRAIYIAEYLVQRALDTSTAAAANAPCLRISPSQQELHFLQEVRKQRSTLQVEPLFIGQVNKLRSSLTQRQQNYAAAQLAFQELLELPISQLLLVRNQEAVESIRLLCRFVNCAPANPADPALVRELAGRLIKRFAKVFTQPFTMPDFWCEYCMLAGIYRRHTVEIDNQSK